MESNILGPTLGAGLFFMVVMILGCQTGCSPQEKIVSPDKGQGTDGKISVLVAVEPIAWLVEQVGGDRVQVDVLVPAGLEPETFSPSPRKAAALTGKEIFFRVGLASEESFLPSLKTVSPKMKIIDLREGLATLQGSCSHADHQHADAEKTVAPSEEAQHHKQVESGQEHADDEKHDHNKDTHDEHSQHEHDQSSNHECGTDGIDPHIWMSPDMTRDMVKRMANELSQIKPSSRALFEENAERLRDRLEELQKRIRASVALLKGRTIFVYHPAYGYFCREFGLEQCAIEMGGRSPKPRDMAAFVTRYKESGAKSIIVQPEFGRGTVESLVQTMQTQVVFHTPLEKDYFKNMEQLVHLIEQMDSKDK
ncbi:MAG: zinc ABC transporter substrate-binding protein [Thermoguttaceae bacterium]|nr:zinc ABC transporter substrate-binding protein [Thermoguttaceae bacterium]